MPSEVKKFEDTKAAAEACGADTLRALDEARRARGAASLAVSGGNTPRVMFEWMARQSFDWKNVELFWVDERCVPVDDAQSNYRMTRESLLDHVALDPRQIHRVPVEHVPDEAALLYAEDIVNTFRLSTGELPVFDVLQRGLGPDAHTASLFPGEPLIENRTGIAAAVWVEKLRQHRVTLLPGVLEKARLTMCLATGSEKAEALYAALRGPADNLRVPARIGVKELVWYVDQAAAARL